ncbi:MAG: Hsp20/alpha crystallin family protein, partial [Acidimicrobiia bacterium]
ETDDGGYRRKEIFEGEFTRTIMLPEGVEVDEITAGAKDGIVTLTVPKSPEVLPRKVKVEIGN